MHLRHIPHPEQPGKNSQNVSLLLKYTASNNMQLTFENLLCWDVHSVLQSVAV
jgi:hypothetical protein